MRTIYFKYLLVDSPDPSRIFNSCILYEKGGKNKYLIPIENSPENKEKKPPIHNYNLQECIDDRLFGILRWIKDDDIDNFFDFHYKNFKGKKYLFINKVEQLLNDKKRINSYLMKPENTINIIKYWIKEKKKELNKPKKTKEKNNYKEPKRTKFYNTVFNEKETTLFAYFLRERKIILQNTTSTLLAHCFGKLTGYSDTQINKNLKSVENCFDISENIKHYETIISELKNLIEYIENEIKSKRPDLK